LILLLAHSSTNYVDIALKRHWHVILLRQVASLQGTQLRAHWLYFTSAICCVTPTVTAFNQYQPFFLSGFTALIGLIVKCCCSLHVPGLAAQHQRGDYSDKQPFLDLITFLSFPIATFSSYQLLFYSLQKPLRGMSTFSYWLSFVVHGSVEHCSKRDRSHFLDHPTRRFCSGNSPLFTQHQRSPKRVEAAH